MAGGWIDDARAGLLRARGPSGAWPYRAMLSPATEPTALAALALLAIAPRDEAPAEAALAGRWLAARQHADGSLGVSAALPEPCWPTPHALLLWTALGGFETASRSASDWLLKMRGLTSTRDPAALTAHDTSLDGWPWLSGTHPWLEPTAMAVLALVGCGFAGHPRVREGLRLIVDRSLASGGWNYGNTAVFGRELRPQPAPTGLALLALARAGLRPTAVDKAIHYLRDALPTIRSGPSLGWGLLGLDAWDSRPPEADDWLDEAAARALISPELATNLAPLLLAASRRTKALFGMTTR